MYILRRCIKISKKVKQISFTYVLLLSLYYISYYNEKGKIKIMKTNVFITTERSFLKRNLTSTAMFLVPRKSKNLGEKTNKKTT